MIPTVQTCFLSTRSRRVCIGGRSFTHADATTFCRQRNHVWCNLLLVPSHFPVQIEDELSRAFQSEPEVEPIFGAVTEFDMSAESLALVSISMLPESRGLIEDINVSALRLLGFNKREVLGRDINAIIPAPFAAVHPALLDLFMSHGRPRVGKPVVV